MSWRRQLPAYSPLPLGAVLAGAAGLVSGAGRARAALTTALARSYSGDDALLTDSGTGALALAIAASLFDTPGSAVALPAYGCYDLATAADGVGARVVLYDLDPATLAPDMASLQGAVARGTRAVVLAHWYGVPVDPAPVQAVTQAAGATLIEDAAQASGATLHGRTLGSFGDLTVLSFGRGKGNTAGRGGALLARGAAGSAALLRARSRLGQAGWGFSQLVQLKAQWLLGRPWLYTVPSTLPFLRLGETVYHTPAPARAMSAVAARALAVTLPLGEREAQARRTNAGRLLQRRVAGVTPALVPTGAEAGWLRLPLLASPAVHAAAASPEARALGIMPGYPLALCDLPGFAERVVNRDDAFAGARELAARLITLPTHSLLSETDLVRLENWLVKVGA